MICQNCKDKKAEQNEFNYILCKECLEYYLRIEIEDLVEMTDEEQELYWRAYEDEHKKL